MTDDHKPTQDQQRQEDDSQTQKAGFWQVVTSVLAGAFGVQSRKKQEMDFSSHSPLPFIVGGLIFTLLFIGTIALIVSLVT
ncbi:DUF2970 domain-containing protein [Marinobacteraceae bacterium S3BR75-40.1]